MNIKMRDLKHVGRDFFFLPRQIDRINVASCPGIISALSMRYELLKQLAHGLFDPRFPLTFLFGAPYRSCWKLATFIGVDKLINAEDYS